MENFDTSGDRRGRYSVAESTFDTLLLREPFDYTKWQRNLWLDKTIEEISQMAVQTRLTGNSN